MYLHRRSVIKIGALNRRINGTMKSPEFTGDDERSCHMLGLPCSPGRKRSPQMASASMAIKKMQAENLPLGETVRRTLTE